MDDITISAHGNAVKAPGGSRIGASHAMQHNLKRFQTVPSVSRPIVIDKPAGGCL